VNSLGNLLTRVTAKKLNPEQCYPGYDPDVLKSLGETCEDLVAELKTLRERVANYYEQHLFYRGLETIAKVVQLANVFLHQHSPWNIKEHDVRVGNEFCNAEMTEFYIFSTSPFSSWLTRLHESWVFSCIQ